jgi:hypothetical protein
MCARLSQPAPGSDPPTGGAEELDAGFADLKREILAAIAAGAGFGEEAFGRLARRVFDHQVANNPFYARLVALADRRDPETWRDIPAVPAAAFKRADIRSFPAAQTRAWFVTSGTTEGESGRHFFPTLGLYEAAILPNFRRHLMPDCDRMPMLILTPPPEEAPHSSLTHMMEVVRRECGGEGSGYFVRGGAVEIARVLEPLRDAQGGGRPLFLLGTAFAFVLLMDEFERTGTAFRLPEGSRIMETGGFKGRTREVPRAQLYPMLTKAFGVPGRRIVNEYGMTELSSQFYDESIAGGEATEWKVCPPFARVAAVDPLSGAAVPDGARGLLRIWDLANLGSVMVLQTEDVGECMGGRFRVFGRVAAAPPRGCSLGAEALLAPPG